VTGLRTIELTDDGILLYDEAFLPSEPADRYFIELRDKCVWEQEPGGFGHMQPRLTASYGDEGVTYRWRFPASRCAPTVDRFDRRRTWRGVRAPRARSLALPGFQNSPLPR